MNREQVPSGTKEYPIFPHVFFRPYGALSSFAAQPMAYKYPRVIHRGKGIRAELLSAASVNNSAAKKFLGMSFNMISHNREDTHRLATNLTARRLTSCLSPSSQAARWSLTNTQWQTASISRSHYKPFARIGQRVF